jgi:hypothetical protein
VPTTSSIGFDESGPHDLGLRAPIGYTTLSALAPDAMTFIAGESPTSGFNTTGSIRATADNIYLGWDGSFDRFGLAKSAGLIGGLAYSSAAGATMSVLQYAGQTIDPALSTPTVRAAWDQAGVFRQYGSAVISGSITRQGSPVLAEDRAANTVNAAGQPFVGYLLTYAREDHTHGTYVPSFSPTSPATTFGLTTTDGTSSSLARSDHNHGTPPAPVTSLTVINNATLSASTGFVTLTNSLTPTFTSMTTTAAASVGTTLGVTGASTFGNNVTVQGPTNQQGINVTISQSPNLAGDATLDLFAAGTNNNAQIRFGGSNSSRIYGNTANGAAVFYTSTQHVFTGPLAVSDYLSGAGVDRLVYGLRSQANVTGGGTITYDGSGYLGWSSRLIIISGGRSASSAQVGYFDIIQPTTGVIPVYGGAPSRSWTAAGVVLNNWESLWYILPVGSPNGTVATNFFITSYVAGTNPPTSDVLLVATHNADVGNVRFCTGHKLVPGASVPAGGFGGSPLYDTNTRVYSLNNVPPYPVTSVAGRLGDVSLTAADIASGNFPGTYTFSSPADGLISFTGGAADGTTFLYSSVGGTQYMRLHRDGTFHGTGLLVGAHALAVPTFQVGAAGNVNTVSYISVFDGSANQIRLVGSDQSSGAWIRNDAVNTVFSTRVGSMYYGFSGSANLTHNWTVGRGVAGSTAVDMTLNAESLTVNNGSIFAAGSVQGRQLLAYNGFVRALSSTANSGLVGLQPGGTGNTGYLEFYAGNGIRQGFIGYSGSTSATSDGGQNYHNASSHYFQGRVDLVSGFTGTTGTLTGNLLINSGAQVYYSGIGTATGIFGSDIRFDTISGGAGAGVGNIGAMTVDAYNIKDGAITSSKLSSAALRTSSIPNGTAQNGRYKLLRFIGATDAVLDSAGQSTTWWLHGNVGASRITDGAAYGGYAIQALTGAADNALMTYGPYYGNSNDYAGSPGLAAGTYRYTVYAKVGSTSSTAPALSLSVHSNTNGLVQNDNIQTTFAATDCGTSYQGVSMVFTLLADSAGTAGIEFYTFFRAQAATNVTVSHFVVEPYDPASPQEITTTFIRDAAITNAKVSDMSVTKLTAGFINADDIYLGGSGHIYAGNKNGGRVELNAAGIQAYQTVNLVQNSSFEVSTAGWTGLNQNLLTAVDSAFESGIGSWLSNFNCAVSITTSKAFYGATSMQMTAVGSGVMNARTAQSFYAVIPGQIYTATAVFSALSRPRAVDVVISWYRADGANITYGTNSSSYDNPVAWTQARFTAQAPANAAYATIFVEVQDVVAGEVHYVDAVGFSEDPTANLLNRSDFEIDLGGWTALNGATSSLSTSLSYTGRNSMFVTTGTGSFGGVGCYSLPPLVVGTQFTFSAYIYSTTAIAAGVLQVVDDAAIANSYPAIPANVWTRVSITGVQTGNNGGLYIRSSGANNISFYVDAVQFVAGPVAPPYLPPTTTNLIINPSFEPGTAYTYGILQAGDSFVQSTSRSYAGSTSALLATSLSTTDTYIEYAQIVQPGTYVASAYVYLTSTAATFLDRDFFFYGQSGAITVTPTTSSVPYDRARLNQWQRVTSTIQVTSAGALGLRFYAPAGSTVNVDALQLELGSVATPYVDGSGGAGYSWESSENQYVVSDFEDGAQPYGGQPNSTIVNSTDLAYSGTHSIKITQATGYVGQLVYGPPATIAPNTTYTASQWVRSTTACTVDMYIEGSGTATWGAAQQAAIPANVWTRLVATFVTPNQDLVTARLNLDLAGPGFADGQLVYLDAVQLEQRSYATPYGLTGVAGASTSIRQRPWVLGGTSLESLTVTPYFQSLYPTPGGGAQSMQVYAMPFRRDLLLGAQTTAAVSPSTTYILSAWYGGFGTAGTNMRVVDANTGAVLATGAEQQGVYARGSFTFTTGPNTTSVRLQVFRSSVFYDSTGFAAVIDSVQLEVGTTPTVFTTNTSASATTFTLASNGILSLTNPQGSRIIMDPHVGLNFYDANSVSKLFLDVTTGNATFAGALQAATGTFTGSLTAATGSFSGQVTATSGYIGTATSGFVINPSYIISRGAIPMAFDATAGSVYAGTGSSYVGMAAGVGFQAGNQTFSLAPFRVDTAGLLTATNANITGTVSATSGNIGGWTMNASQIYSGAGGNSANSITLDSANGFITAFGATTSDYVALYRGNGAAGANIMRVSKNGVGIVMNVTNTGDITLTGALTASSLNITGPATINSTLTLGTGSIVSTNFNVTSNGSVTATNVNLTGAITATSGTFTGTVNAASGTIGGFTLSAAQIVSVSTKVILDSSGFVQVVQATGTTAYMDGRASGGSNYLFYAGVNNMRKFSIDNAGNAYFSGALAAATGDFTGQVNATSGSFSGNITASGTITGGTLTGATITGTNITATNTISGYAVVAGTISTQSFSTAAFSDNLILNGGFEDETTPGSNVVANWQPNYQNSGTGTTTYREGTASVIHSGAAGLTHNVPINTGTSTASSSVAVAPGDTYSIKGYIFPTNQPGPFYVRVYYSAVKDFTPAQFISNTPAVPVMTAPNGANPTAGAGFSDLISGFNFPAAGSLYLVEGSVVVPTTAKWMRLVLFTWVNGTAAYYGTYDDWTVRKQLSTTQIADGVITTGKIVASGISGGVITANTLSANTITTSFLNPSTMLTVGNAGAARIEVDARVGTQGLRFYNASNQITFNADANSGNVSITGTVTATAGTIGGYAIGATTLSAGTGTTQITLDTTQGIWLGASTFAAAPFSVNRAGSLYSTSGRIGGWLIGTFNLYSSNILLDNNTGTISVGSAASTVNMNKTDGIFAGGSTFASAPFSVSLAGALYATAANITGAINATSGSFSGNVTSAATISGAGITGSTITGGSLNIGSGAFTVNSSGQLYCNSVNLSGYINATSGNFSGAVYASSLSVSGATIAGDATVTGTLTGGTFVGSNFTTGTPGAASPAIEITKSNGTNPGRINAYVASDGVPAGAFMAFSDGQGKHLAMNGPNVYLGDNSSGGRVVIRGGLSRRVQDNSSVFEMGTSPTLSTNTSSAVAVTFPGLAFPGNPFVICNVSGSRVGFVSSVSPSGFNVTVSNGVGGVGANVSVVVSYIAIYTNG